MNLTVYEKSTCSKCREVNRILKDSGIPFQVIEYYSEGISPSKLLGLAKKMNSPLTSLLRKNNDIFRKLNLSKRKLSDKELALIMSSNPDLIQRPILETKKSAIIGRPTKKILPFIKKNFRL